MSVMSKKRNIQIDYLILHFYLYQGFMYDITNGKFEGSS